MRIRVIVSSLLVFFIGAPFLVQPLAAQRSEDPQALLSTPESGESPRFYIEAVGDYPDGYFDDVQVLPGESVALRVAVINFGSVPVELRSFKVNANNGENGGFAPGEIGDAPREVTSWVDYPTVAIGLEPGERNEIEFTVSVPEDAAPGQYVAGLMVQTAEPVAIAGTDVLNQLLGYSISVGILVPGELYHSFELGKPAVTENVLQVPIENTGNYRVRPAGTLILADENGQSVLTAPVEMGSVYGGLSTNVSVFLPDQIPPGEYAVEMTLKDPESGVSDSIDGALITIEEPVDPTGVFVTNAGIEPNAEDITFANVDVTLDNGGQQIPATNVTLEVMRDGEQVDSFPLATNQVLLSGENQFVTRYLPADMWQSGQYTFSVKVSAVDPNGGQETVLLDEELDATIVVP